LLGSTRTASVAAPRAWQLSLEAPRVVYRLLLPRYCSGQSNMELDFKYTFERNVTMAKIAAGRYDNMRVYLHPHVTSPKPLHVITGNESEAESEQGQNLGAGAAGPSLEYSWTHVKDAVNSSSWQESLLLEFSAACLYMVR
jgi:hypothetical protein